MLIVDGEEIAEAPEVAIRLKNIRECKVQSNFIVDLNLSSNQLESFEVGEEGLPNLRKLDLIRNRLLSFTLSGGKFPKLRTLYLSFNHQLASFKIDGKCPNLETLALSENRLASFVVDENLPNLEEIYINNNQLVSFEVAENLQSIRYIYLYDNLLTSVVGGGVYPNLRAFSLVNNPELASLDLRIVGTPITQVFLRNTNVNFVDKSLLPYVRDREVKPR